jgi:hypothetical protein
MIAAMIVGMVLQPTASATPLRAGPRARDYTAEKDVRVVGNSVGGWVAAEIDAYASGGQTTAACIPSIRASVVPTQE